MIDLRAGATFVLGLLTLAEVGQIVGLMIVLVTFLYVGRQKTWRNEAEAQEKRAQRLVDELRGASDRAEREHELRRGCERTIAHLQGEMKTLERYTAQGALETVASELHTTRTTIVGAIEAQGELVLKNTEILSKLDEHLSPRPRSDHRKSQRDHEPGHQ